MYTSTTTHIEIEDDPWKRLPHHLRLEGEHALLPGLIVQQAAAASETQVAGAKVCDAQQAAEGGAREQEAALARGEEEGAEEAVRDEGAPSGASLRKLKS